MRIHDIDAQGYWAGGEKEIPDNAPIPVGWTNKVVPESVPEDHYVRIGPDREFYVTDVPPVVLDQPAAPTYKIINKARYFLMVRGVAQMTNAQFAAYDNDPDPDMVTVRALMGAVTTDIDINNPDNMAAVVEALDLMAVHSHTGQIPDEYFTDAILGYWALL